MALVDGDHHRSSIIDDPVALIDDIEAIEEQAAAAALVHRHHGEGEVEGEPEPGSPQAVPIVAPIHHNDALTPLEPAAVVGPVVAPSNPVASESVESEPENTWEEDPEPEPPAYVAPVAVASAPAPVAVDNGHSDNAANPWVFVPCDDDLWIDIHELMTARGMDMKRSAPSSSEPAVPSEVAAIPSPSAAPVPVPSPAVPLDDEFEFVPTTVVASVSLPVVGGESGEVKESKAESDVVAQPSDVHVSSDSKRDPQPVASPPAVAAAAVVVVTASSSDVVAPAIVTPIVAPAPVADVVSESKREPAVAAPVVVAAATATPSTVSAQQPPTPSSVAARIAAVEENHRRESSNNVTPTVAVTTLSDPTEGAKPRGRATAIWQPLVPIVDDNAKPGLSLIAHMAALASPRVLRESKRGSNIAPVDSTANINKSTTTANVDIAMATSSSSSSAVSSAPPAATIPTVPVAASTVASAPASGFSTPNQSPPSSAPPTPSRTPFDDVIATSLGGGNKSFAPSPTLLPKPAIVGEPADGTRLSATMASASASPSASPTPSRSPSLTPSRPAANGHGEHGHGHHGEGEDDPFLFVPMAVEKEGEGEYGEGQMRSVPGSPVSTNSHPSSTNHHHATMTMPPSPMAIDMSLINHPPLEHKLSGLSLNGHRNSGMDSVGSSPGVSPGGSGLGFGAGGILLSESKRSNDPKFAAALASAASVSSASSSRSSSPMLSPLTPSSRAAADEQAAKANARGVKAAEEDEAKRAADLLMFNTALLRRGGEFMKYGRQGKPHLCQVKCSHDLTKVIWGDKSAPSSKIMDVIQGRNTKVFARSNSNINVHAITSSFSLVWPDRTLDLEVNKKGPRAETDCEEWVGAFRWLMGHTAAPQALPADWKTFNWTVKDVYAHFQGTEVNLLLQKGRTFVKLFILGRQSKLGSSPRWMFMFNDLIVFTTPPERDKLTIKTVIPLKSSRVSDRTARIKPASPLALCLVTPTLTHVLICTSLDMKADLVACFTATLRAQLVHESKTNPNASGSGTPPLHPPSAASVAAALHVSQPGTPITAAAVAAAVKDSNKRLASRSSSSSSSNGSGSHVRSTPARGSGMDIRAAPDLMRQSSAKSLEPTLMRPHQSIIASISLAGGGVEEGVVDDTVSEHSLHLGTLWSACYVPDDALAFDLISDPTTNLNQRDYQGSTPLHIAAFRGNTKIMEMLLRATGGEGRSKRCEVDGLNTSGQSTLWLIAVAGSVRLADVIRLLTRYGADPNQILATTKQTLLEACSEHKRVESIRVLHESGASFHPRYTKALNRFSCLHYATQANHLPTVTQLVQLGAPVNARDSQLNTPLHLTTSAEIAAYLAGHGARLALLNDAGVAAGAHFASHVMVTAGEANYTGGKEMPGDDDVPDEKQWRTLCRNTDKCDYCVAAIATPLHCRRCGAATCGACSTKIFRHKTVSGALRCCDACYNALRYKMEWWDSSAGAEVLGGGAPAISRDAMLEGIMDSIFD